LHAAALGKRAFEPSSSCATVDFFLDIDILWHYASGIFPWN
jgi:hypothetical protein